MRRSHPIRCALGLVIVLFGGALAAQPAAAGTVDQQEQQVKDVVAELDRMHEKVGQYNEEYLAALNDKAAVEAEIAVSQQRVAEQQAALGVLQGQLTNVAVEQFMGGGGNGALGPLFTDPAQIGDGLQRQHLASVAVNAGAASTDDYETLLSDLDKQERALEQQQATAQSLADQAEGSRIKAETAEQALSQRLVDEEARLGSLIEEEQQRQADAAAAAYRQQVAAAQAAQAAAANKPSTGGGSGNNASSGNSGGSTSGSTGGGTTSGDTGSGAGASGGSSGGGSSSGGSGDSGSGDSGSGASNPPPVSSRASVAVNAAAGQIGVPYQFAQSSPGVAFDCSGLTAYAWGQAGVNLPHQSAAQYASTPRVPKEQAQPGDLIYYYSPISHVGIYTGGGSMIHAPSTGKTVSYTTVRWDKVIGVTRPG